MILALESSCDESALALFDPARGLAGEWVHSQIALHEKHGGVVPDLATREHLRTFAPLLERVKAECGLDGVRQIAVTHGPGLAACLAIGTAAAKALGLALRVPVVGVNHLRGHAWSPFIALHAATPATFATELGQWLPHLGLIVSGGNTLLFTLAEDRRITVLSSTRDDAAGEALDKGAKLLGLGYPGGPRVERLAATGKPDAFDFPRGIGRRDELDFSFSGLKTSLRYRIEKMPAEEVQARISDLCASYQQAVVDALVRKVHAALRQGEGRFRSLGLSGGVANNRTLRAALEREAQRARVRFAAAQPKHTGDNAGMIAFAAWADTTGVERDAGMGLRVEPSAPLA
ncbi:tRNA (adenosine(37)-N6)-threonylcarbamoyltransferase complex transferase subunit TsaD [Opitutus sp. ER46]|uniref:tRNA (adenosine(37)-N6)-threonylcarbamoyltransferase complex transferase subunit TsaD n=1 Tax=Opitutus sp. ER46 TaxID=2161864 RepID=UPI000D320379|nr:tRNA (adenosine(37)-N6)-threonylcarbamoyltransferase complex transferase subunit TsaD [Opitutus sp. ER46]PTX92640.1 tRNA (adenosine(37)-N6)-threonylcarbamoyltransferase complex transferase subunit TsaD [Opitutus sp. ER46]